LPTKPVEEENPYVEEPKNEKNEEKKEEDSEKAEKDNSLDITKPHVEDKINQKFGW
jgi:hypothetical protein